jgi:putative spermidine/putrescine transport system permease protein
MRRALSLLPVLLVIGGLFGGGLVLALVQSLGYFAPAGEHSFTLAHYQALVWDKEIRLSVLLTFALGSVSTIVSAVLGVSLALAFRGVAKGNRILTALLQVPIGVPHLAMAIVLIDVAGQSGLVARVLHVLGLAAVPAAFPELINDRYGIGIAAAYVLKETPFIALVALAMLRRVADDYELVAATLGASSWQRFRYVTLPLIAPAVISASLLVFAFVFGAFEIPYVLGRPYPAMLGVIAQRRFMSIDLVERPDAIAVAVFMSAVSTLLIWAYLHLSRHFVGDRPALF